jgi:hypothetical protein
MEAVNIIYPRVFKASVSLRQHKTCSGNRKTSLHLQVHDVEIFEEGMWLTAREKVATETKCILCVIFYFIS